MEKLTSPKEKALSKRRIEKTLRLLGISHSTAKRLASMIGKGKAR